MANVISIEGSHGVGKTTLVRNLKQKFTEAFFYDEQGIKELQLKKEQSKYRMHVESEFYEIQKWYIQHEIDRFNYLA